MKFIEYNIDEKILRALDKLGYIEATPVQEVVLPKLKEDQDVIVKAKTGSGKTAAFAIPLVDKVIWEENKPQVLILSPTRELALQIKEDFDNIGTYKKIKTLAIFGKQPYKFQIHDLKQKNHIVVATPGRLLDHLERGTFDVSNLKYVVLDEADVMLNMGFIETIEEILEQLPKNRVTCLFSATMEDKIEQLASHFMNNPSRVEIKQQDVISEQIEAYGYEVIEHQKLEFLLKLLIHEKPSSAIIFCKTQERVDEVYDFLNQVGLSICKIHGGMLQEDRFQNMSDFRLGKRQFLVATNVASRGIDVENITHVINYDLPDEAESYIHRIGRTARIGNKGVAISLLSKYDHKQKASIEEFTNTTFKINKAQIIDKILVTEEALDSLQERVIRKERKNKELQKDITKLYFSVGKQKKIAPGNLVGAICAVEGITGEDIGVIQVQDICSYVDILNGKGTVVAKQLNNTLIKGRKMKVEVAKDN